MTFQGKSPGLNQAFLTLTNLVAPATGTFPTQVNEANGTHVKTQLDTLANAMGACNVSAGATSAACAELFTCATAGSTFVATGQACMAGSSTARTDTSSAAIAVSQNAGTVSPTGVYDVSLGSAAFTPALTGPLAIDAAGHVWLLSSDPNPVNPSLAIPPLAVFELDADGSLNSPSLHGFTAGGISSNNAAGGGTVPKGIAIDGAGHKWVANQGTSGNQSSVTEFTAAGTANLSNSDGFGFGAITGAYSVGIDGSGNVWAADGGTVVAEFVGLAAPTKNPIASAVTSGSFAP